MIASRATRTVEYEVWTNRGDGKGNVKACLTDSEHEAIYTVKTLYREGYAAEVVCLKSVRVPMTLGLVEVDQ